MRHYWIYIFWIISIVALYGVFTFHYDSGMVHTIYTICFLIPLIIVVQINLYIIEHFLSQKKYLHYICLASLLIPLGISLHYLIFDIITPHILSGYYMISMTSIWEVGLYTLAHLIISVLIKLSIDWHYVREEQLILDRVYKTNQLSHLKSQLNPHLLFNSLNNIYSMTSTDIEKGRESIIRLSDTLRYMLYNTDNERVPLVQELEYIDNYIGLEKLRLESLDNITTDIPTMSSDYTIAPLVLLPFVENCFKHCNKNNPEIDIRIELKHRELYLYCKNNKRKNNSKLVGGLGLTNAQERLTILYPELHKLNITNGTNYYRVELEIKLDEEA